MKKELGVHPYLFPMPVLMIATYGDDNVVDVMNMAWGGICAENMVSLNIDEDHKTSENIKKRGAFTLSIADIPHIEAADFFGIASGNKMPDKFERSGLSAVKSEKVDAPIVQEFPLTLECKVIYHQEQDIRQMPQGVIDKFYPLCEKTQAPDMHTAFYGEIVNAYLIEDN